MTDEEALKLAGICQTADGGCKHCVPLMLRQCELTFPDIDWKSLFAKVEYCYPRWDEDELTGPSWRVKK